LSRDIDRFAIDLVADRRRAPRDPGTDMASGLIAHDADGRRFTEEEVAGMIRLLLIGGHTVPKNFLGSAVWHLARDANLQERLRHEPQRLRAAIEELLRYYSANQALVRVATKDVSIGGREIPEGCPVALHFLSANQDEEVFEAPDVFDAERSPNRHIAFGIGPHICIGQSVARLQARLALSGLLARTANFSVAGAPQWARWTEFGISELSLMIGPAA
jgi:cytochrome P450